MNELIKFDKPFNVIQRIDYTEELLNVPIKLWLSEIEKGTMDQYYNLARLPFIFKHIAAMGDSHLGYGMPIGGVIATKGYVIPNAAGSDVGCGVICIRTNLTEMSTKLRKKIMSDIRKLIPVGFKHNKEPQKGMPFFDLSFYGNIIKEQYESAIRQLGTLGSGNHFIEIQMGDDGFIYIMIHSGSRNLGYRVADHYNKVAIELNEKWFSQVPTKWELAFLPMQSNLGEQYMEEMEYCVKFAHANRMQMLERVKEAFSNHTYALFYDSSMINIAHNYIRLENHFGENVIIHRKGATSAYKGELGIIPGSQGSKSYIVKGKGNKDSFTSCSHGAGRSMGRKAAQRDLNLEEEIKKLDDQGIVHGIRNIKDLEEATGSYKDIEDVMAHQTNLVEIVRELKPLAVVKG